MKSYKKGFTLIELLVVMAIMSILTIVAVSQFQNAKKKARDTKRRADLSAVSKALQMFYADYGEFPSTNPSVGVPEFDIGAIWGGSFQDGNHVYMKVMPIESTLDDYPYCYVVSADNTAYGLFTYLESSGDTECQGNNYTCDGRSGYCYSIVSPNVTVDEMSE
ncbi:type II secretion system GspH family protein [Patescibacteria group bacterium]|nr:type II secretion system GspH family protein [Patescibacteria group bacterium]MCG2702696.1 type II secretion system GspH family protein [Candidatus Parcubacteria bacterium]MBU4210765.1 type II secretion system GspH family protein [Patescibacteria group bacterium]MBU4265311.1 type II secretion system GspH family protein [Patescibacteria group bacterium]MBU4389996.1 type II secretion system GspH family protein [Patescibacteria group bacterium]